MMDVEIVFESYHASEAMKMFLTRLTMAALMSRLDKENIDHCVKELLNDIDLFKSLTYERKERN